MTPSLSFLFGLMKGLCLQSLAVTFERGDTLRSLLLCVEQHIAFAENHGIPVAWNFPSLLMSLVSDRPSVFAEAMDSFSNLRLLAIRVVHAQFEKYVKSNSSLDIDPSRAVSIYLHPTAMSEGGPVTVPIELLQATSVVLSIWKGGEQETEGTSFIDDLLGALTTSSDDQKLDEGESKQKVGLASSTMVKTSKPAVSVESVRAGMDF